MYGVCATQALHAVSLRGRARVMRVFRSYYDPYGGENVAVLVEKRKRKANRSVGVSI